MTATLDLTVSTAFLLIDNQRGLDGHEEHWGRTRSNPGYKENVRALLAAFREARREASKKDSVHIIHVGHSSDDPQSPLHHEHPDGGTAFDASGQPEGDDEPVFWKKVNSAFIGTELEQAIRGRGVKQLVIAGLTTDHCVSTTVRMAGNLKVTGPDGRVILVEDATSAHEKGGYDAETIQGVSVASLREFAEIWRTADVVSSLKGNY